MGLKLKMYANNINIINNNIEKFVLRIILWSFGALAVWYVLLLGNMVFNIIERQQLETDARVLSSEVGNLELIYLSMSNNIDLAFSRSMGFKEIKAKFATRKSLGSLGRSSIGEALGSIKMLQNEI